MKERGKKGCFTDTSKFIFPRRIKNKKDAEIYNGLVPTRSFHRQQSLDPKEEWLQKITEQILNIREDVESVKQWKKFIFVLAVWIHVAFESGRQRVVISGMRDEYQNKTFPSYRWNIICSANCKWYWEYGFEWKAG